MMINEYILRILIHYIKNMLLLTSTVHIVPNLFDKLKQTVGTEM